MKATFPSNKKSMKENIKQKHKTSNRMKLIDKQTVDCVFSRIFVIFCWCFRAGNNKGGMGGTEGND